MDPQPGINLQDCKSEILKRHLMQTINLSGNEISTQQNVTMSSLRPSVPSNMIMSSIQAPQQNGPQLLAHQLPSVKIHASQAYPMQLPTVHMPMHISAPITVPLQMSAAQMNVSSSAPQLSVPMQSVPLNLNAHSMAQLCTNGRPADNFNIQNHDMNGELPKIKLGNTNTTIQAVPVSKQLQVRNPTLRTTGPQTMYIKTSTGLKISQVGTNPQQLILKKPVTTSGLQILGKANIAPKVAIANKPSILSPATPSQPIVIKNAKSADKILLPANSGKPVTIISSVKKNKCERQSKILPTQPNSNGNNQTVLISKSAKFLFPVAFPATMASKGPFINLQIANGQLQNDPQGTITVMSDSLDNNDNLKMNGTQCLTPKSSDMLHKGDNAYPLSIPGSRAEPTGEQEYTLSIPETNATMNDDIYTAVSIAEEDGAEGNDTSFRLPITEKGKSLLFDKDVASMVVPAPAIMRRSYSDNSERDLVNLNLKRRISLCTDNAAARRGPFNLKKYPDTEETDDHRVPSLFCDEKLDRELDMKATLEVCRTKQDSRKENKYKTVTNDLSTEYLTNKISLLIQNSKVQPVPPAPPVKEDPPGVKWDNGVGVLNGSTIRFETNEFGLMDVLCGDSDGGKYERPLQERRGAIHRKTTSPENLYKCDGCGCHGIDADFISTNFCSSTCQLEVEKLINKKKGKELFDMLKKRNKMKKSLLKKTPSENENGDTLDKMTMKQYDAMALDGAEEIDEGKYPWMCAKSGFSWKSYLLYCNAIPAPVKLFKDPLPYNHNDFKVGMRLEAIDPCHPSFFCVVSVAEVQGYRMRLHFDEYPDKYDFWVNADCVDIFPIGWCEKHGGHFRKPPSCSNTFSWSTYLKQVKAPAAPRQLFSHVTNNVIKPNGFRVGMKLEAEDRKNNLVCVASVAEILENRIHINFDSWDEMYDLWVDPTSPYIHPVGWAAENHLPLMPPNFIKDPETFCWDTYLSQTGATAAPARAFKPRAPMGFQVGMKVEVVDKRVPFLIRVATISDVKGYQVRISFDGWADELSYWLDDDSPDIHPVGWCLKAEHPLEPPLTDRDQSMVGLCGVAGCRGLGSLLGGGEKTHMCAELCPYSDVHARTPTDRLGKELGDTRGVKLPSKAPQQQRSTSPHSTDSKPRGRPPKHKAKPEPVSDEDSVASSSSKRYRQSTKEVEASLTTEYNARDTAKTTGTCGIKLAQILQQLSLSPQPRHWNESEVLSLVKSVAGEEAAVAVKVAKLGGAELLMASREELVDCLHLKLGPALKIYTTVRMLRSMCI